MNPKARVKEWKIKYIRKADESLWQALLAARQIQNPGSFFSSAAIEDLNDPFLFEDMKKAVYRILQALQLKERIVVYGDYDVDGTSGAALLIHTLDILGAKVSYRIPHRHKDGYGLHDHYVEELADKSVSLIITVDCGISCYRQVELVNKKKIDLIITDHHSLPEKIPNAYAILHPALSQNYPFKDLSGSGVAFKLACALLEEIGRKDFITSLTDIACLGTVADCVPLHGENRTIVKLGLKQMQVTKWDGLKAILQSSGVWGSPSFCSDTVGFQIGPRINASGRMDSPYWALQTLLSNGLSSMEKAMQLEKLNLKRRELTKSVFEEAEYQVDLNRTLLIASNQNWPSGIVGLIAGRLQEKYGKPAFIMEEREDKLVGSARSLPGFHCLRAIEQAESLLISYGGHEQAAGFSLHKENLEDFKSVMHKYADEFFKQKPLKHILEVDCMLHEEDFNIKNIKCIDKFAPFGVGNFVPRFLMNNVQVNSIKTVGSEGGHLKFSIKFGQVILDGIAFNFSQDKESFEQAKDLVVELAINEWNGISKPQIKLIDYR